MRAEVCLSKKNLKLTERITTTNLTTIILNYINTTRASQVQLSQNKLTFAQQNATSYTNLFNPHFLHANLASSSSLHSKYASIIANVKVQIFHANEFYFTTKFRFVKRFTSISRLCKSFTC